MSIDNPISQIKEQTKLWASADDIHTSKSNIETSQKLRAINNVLQILDFPNNQEKTFRTILEKQNPSILQNLATKSKKDILTFLISKNNQQLQSEKIKTTNIKSEESEKQSKETQKTNNKLLKIKAVFTPTVLENNPDIAEKLEILEGLDEPLEKEKILQEILQILKNPWRLKSIIDNFGGADKSNPLYVEFKSALVGLDSDFKKYFEDLERISWWVSFDSDEVIESVEWNSGGMIDIDLNANPPISKMSLIWSDYSFDKVLDKKALSKLQAESKEVLGAVQNGFAILKGLYKPFDILLKQIRGIWWQSHFKEKLKAIVNAFSKDIFDDLGKMYKDMGIKSNTQINQNDIDTLADSHSASDLKSKIETIKAKLIKIKEQLTTKKSWIFKEYQADIKQLIKRDSTEKKRELEVLQFMKSSGFDLFPKEITNRLIKELMSNTLIIPNLPLSLSNINLKNGNFGESSIFINKKSGLNIEAKRNLVKFVNKMISWNINEPLVVESIVNGVSVIDPLEMKHKILKAGISNGLGWKYSKIIENLRTK